MAKNARCVVKSLVKDFAFPVLWELLFIVMCIMRPIKTLYLFFVFYLVLLVYYHESFSIKEFYGNFKKIKKFWIPVVITFIAMLALYWVKTNVIQRNIIMLDGTFSITWENSYLGELLYAITIMFLGPIAGEIYYRKAVMRFDTIASTMISFVVGLLLCGFGSAYLPLGVAEAVMLAIPLALCYFITRNVYVSMAANILFMMYQHIPNIVYDVARISLR
ncbi:hypothetical protein [Butyrivibrio sp. WCD3002]|uniref:hypothetical protein n=1 Tax=Butyrivibrio sp. WCD3002 TaxID=1280676 RepID=UPI00047A905E|nr:hypothetical protein [Butyrivibrio sp. WCD3002]